MTRQAFICDAIRTPFGRYGGALSSVRTDDLAAIPLKALMARNPKVDWQAVADVLYGCANQAGEDNRNVAHMASLLAGLPLEVPGATINRLCGSGLDAVGSAARAIKAGEATLMIADAFPQADVHGLDSHEASVERAREAATGRAGFAVGAATGYPTDGWDLITFFDALHDMGDPLDVARHARAAVAADGTVLVVEPAAGDRVADNLHPVGLTYYAASTLFCVPGALSQGGGADVLGAQAGQRRLTALLREAGFSRVRVVARTDMHLVVEARP